MFNWLAEQGFALNFQQAYTRIYKKKTSEVKKKNDKRLCMIGTMIGENANAKPLSPSTD